MEQWWDVKSTCPMVLIEKPVIFGLYFDLIHFSSIHFVLLLGKMYNYRQKCNEKTIYFNYFWNELKCKLDITKTIGETNNTHSGLTLVLSISDSLHQIVLFCSYLFNTNAWVSVMYVSVKIISCHQKL